MFAASPDIGPLVRASLQGSKAYLTPLRAETIRLNLGDRLAVFGPRNACELKRGHSTCQS